MYVYALYVVMIQIHVCNGTFTSLGPSNHDYRGCPHVRGECV